MLTPKFEIIQNNDHVTVTIFATYANISDAEIHIDGNSFTFYSSPYHLRLYLPGSLVDSELEKHTAKFDADLGAFVVICEKETKGQYFPNLDMLTTLLAPPGATGVNKPLIEVVSGEGENEEEEEEEFDWTYEQKLPEENVVTSGQKYGFGNSTTGVFAALQNELKGVIDVCDPDNKSASRRRQERLEQERNVFDEDHYLADYFEQDMAQHNIEFIPEYFTITADEVELTVEEKEDLLKLPRKEHLLDKGTKSSVYLGLVDLLYGWCYNHRVTQGENCVESAWNVAKLSSILSWLDSFSLLKDVAVSSVRRSLIFPLIRNWHLSQQVLKDTVQILSLGRKKVLQCLLEIQRFFNHSEPRYLLNQLYITDYCVWIQRVKDDKLISLADSLRRLKLVKADMCLELEELEAAAHLVLEEDIVASGDPVNLLASDLAGLTVIQNGAALGVNDNQLPVPDDLNCNREALADSSSDSDSSSSDSDSDDESDSSDSSDSSDEDSSSDSSDLDSDDDSLSEQ